MKKKWIALSITVLMVLSLVGSTAAQGSFPQTPILDNFNRANEGPPPSANWMNDSYGYPGVSVVNNAAQGVGSQSVALWQSSFGANAELYATIVKLPDDEGWVSIWMGNTDTINDNQAGARIQRDDTGGDTIEFYGMAPTTIDLQTGDSFGIRFDATRASLWHRPVSGTWTEVVNVDRNTMPYTGGRAAILLDIEHSAAFDDVGGGTLSSATPTATPPIVIGDLNIDLDFDAVMDYVNMVLAGLAGLFEALIGIALGYAVVSKLVRVWRESRA